MNGKIDFIIKNKVKDAFIYLYDKIQEKCIKKLLNTYNTNNTGFKLIDYKTDLYKFHFYGNQTHEIINDYSDLCGCKTSLRIDLNFRHNQLISIQEVSKEQFFNYIERRELPFNDNVSDNEDEDNDDNEDEDNEDEDD